MLLSKYQALLKVFSLCFFCTYQSIAQDQNNPFQHLDFSTPNATALDKYGNIPVGYHTGVPQITVPILEIAEGTLSLPISLSYHASGLKVMETASWIGAGWTLMAGGAINRTIQGLPDEKQDMGRGFGQQTGYYNNLGFSNYVNDDPNHADFYSKNFNTTIGGGIVDAEPDRYYINVPGFSGKFYFNDDQSAIFDQSTDVKVIPYKGNDGGFKRWEVILPNGVRYTFASQQDQTEPITERVYSYNEEQGIGTNFRAAVSSWLLTEMSSPNRQDKITFHYLPEKYGYHTLVPSSSSRGSTATRIKYSVQGWRLSEIRYSQGKVVFKKAINPRQDLSNYSIWDGGDEINQEAYALDEIEWQDKAANCHKKFKLITSYFDATSSKQYFVGAYTVNSDKKRLKLDQVQEIGCGSINKPAYIFSYYQETEVPRRLSYAQDHWGFYNGAVDNNNLLPEDKDSPTTIVGPLRESSFPSMQAGTLKQIQYPTGGSVTFEYEANQVWRKYEEKVVAQSASAFINTSGKEYVFKSINLSRGNYKIEYTTSSQSEQANSYLEGLQNGQVTFGGAFPKTGSPHTEVLTLEGAYTIRAKLASDAPDASSGTMRIYAVTIEKREGDFLVGGLRIKKIIHLAEGQNLSQRFEYTKNYVFGGESQKISSAALYGRPIYRSFIRNNYFQQVGIRYTSGVISNNDPDGCLLQGNPDATTLTSIFSIFPMEEVQGYHIGYEVVTEYEPDGGYTIYNFNTSSGDDPNQPIAVYGFGDGCNAQTPNYPPAPRPYNSKAGRLYQKIVMGSNEQKKQLTLYDDTFEAEKELVPGLILSNVQGQPFITSYKLSSYKLTSQTVTNYLYNQNDDSQRIESKQYTEYKSNKHYQITASSEEVNNGTRRQQFTYPSDHTRSIRIGESSRGTYETALQNNLNAFNQKTSTTGCSSETACWYNAFKERERLDLKARSDYSQRNADERSQTIANLANDYNNASAKYRAIINLQANNQISQPIESALFEDDKFLKASYIEYQDGETARDETISKVYPYQRFLFQTNIPLESSRFTPIQVNSGDLKIDTDYIFEDSMKFQQGRIVELTTKGGMTTAYLWGYGYKFPVAKLDDATFTQASATVDLSALQNMDGQALRDELDKLRNLSKTTVSTYTYKPLIGITSETDPGGITTFYEYDTFGRLKIIKDNKGKITQNYKYHLIGQPHP